MRSPAGAEAGEGQHERAALVLAPEAVARGEEDGEAAHRRGDEAAEVADGDDAAEAGRRLFGKVPRKRSHQTPPLSIAREAQRERSAGSPIPVRDEVVGGAGDPDRLAEVLPLGRRRREGERRADRMGGSGDEERRPEAPAREARAGCGARRRQGRDEALSSTQGSAFAEVRPAASARRWAASSGRVAKRTLQPVPRPARPRTWA